MDRSPPAVPARANAAITQALARRSVRLLVAALSGACLALTLPPLDLVPAIVAWAALLGVLAAGERVARRRTLERALIGGAFGFGYHLLGLWWTGEAFLVDAATFGPLLPLGVVGLPLLLAPFHALATALLGLGPRAIGWRVLTLAVAVGFSEWLRGVVFTGFPWNVPAVQLSGATVLVQGAAVVGVDGLAVAAVLIGAAPAALFVRGRRWAAAAGAATLAMLFAYGTIRLDGAQVATFPTPVRIVQPSVPQDNKWNPQRRDEIWATLLGLSARPSADGAPPPIVVWPETALPFLYRTPSLAQDDIAATLGPGRTLVTGVVEIEPGVDGERATNSIYVLGDKGELRAALRQAPPRPVRRVPAVRAVPVAALGMEKLVEGTSQFAAGAQRVLIDLPGLPPALPLICYEVIFRQDVAGAGWIINVTNDAWFGDTPGPRQHLRHAQLRAIESGLAVVRAANNGISAVIDPYGRVRDRLELNQKDVLDVTIPQPVATPYHTRGDVPLFTLWLVVGLGLLINRTFKLPLARKRS